MFRLMSSLLAAAVVSLICGMTAVLELPPGSFDKLKIGAEEALVIQITSVKTTPAATGKDVTLEAKVLGIERSKSGQKKDDVITIQYFAQDPNVPIPGPRIIPVLAKDEVYPGFLNKKRSAKVFEPAAYGESFHMTPEM
jgi:hypothetical protein